MCLLLRCAFNPVVSYINNILNKYILIGYYFDNILKVC